MKLFTIGFTKKTARRFFEMLRTSGARSVVDVRLNNVSQLAGFAKKEDLAYFLKEICGHPPRKCWTSTRKKAGTGRRTRRVSST